MPISASLSARVALTVSPASAFPPIEGRIVEGFAANLTNGVGVNQGDRVYVAERTLAASATENLDLAGGGLTDPFGVALTFARVKAIYVEADPTNTNNVIVGGAPSNAFVGPLGGTTPTVTLAPGEVFMVTNRTATGWAVTAGTGDLLRLANSGAGTQVKYKIIIIGAAT